MTDPYLRASKKFSKVKAQAKERLDTRKGKPPAKPDKPAKPRNGG